jgi:gluconokinase
VTADGGVQIDADRLIAIVFETLDELMARVTGLEIEAVAVCTFWHNLMGVDKQSRAVTPLLSWNDTRAASAARRLRREIDERALHRRTGCVPHASYWPAKLLWMRETMPEVFNRVARWISIGEYLHLRLFGKTSCSISMASATGLLDQNRCDWDEEILTHVKIDPDHLSPLEDAGFAGLSEAYAARWPALREARWFASVGDGACSNIGSGCSSKERAALMVGTSGALRVLWKAEAATIPPGLWCYRADSRRFVMGGALSNGGDLFDWMRNTLRLGSVAEVEAQLAAMMPDAHGLAALPFLSGERSTGWHDDARAVIAGLSLSATPIDILRAGLESVAYRFAAIYDLIAKEIGEPRELIASGAALISSPAWMQIISDVVGRPMIASSEREASSRGVALMALEAMGAISGIEDLDAPTGRVYEPDPEHHKLYIEARARHQRLYESLVATSGEE